MNLFKGRVPGFIIGAAAAIIGAISAVMFRARRCVDLGVMGEICEPRRGVKLTFRDVLVGLLAAAVTVALLTLYNRSQRPDRDDS